MAASRVSPGTLSHPSRREQTQREASHRVTYLAELCTWSPSGKLPSRVFFSPTQSVPTEQAERDKNRKARTGVDRVAKVCPKVGPKLITQIPKKTNDATVSESPSSLKNTVGRVKHSDQEALLSCAGPYNERGQICLSSGVTNHFTAVRLGNHHSGGERAMARVFIVTSGKNPTCQRPIFV